MAKTVIVTQTPELKVDEKLSDLGEGVGGNTFGHDQPSSGKLNASTDPDAQDVWSGQLALSAGSATLDLAALVYTSERPNVDLTALKVVAFKFVCPLTNSGPIRIEGNDAGNPYELFGDADTEIQLHPGEYCVKGILNGGGAVLAAVAAGVKEVLFSGSGTDVINITITAGDDNP